MLYMCVHPSKSGNCVAFKNYMNHIKISEEFEIFWMTKFEMIV